MSALPSAEVFIDTASSITGIDNSGNPAWDDFAEVTMSTVGARAFEITVSGQLSRTGGTGSDSLITYLNDTAGRGSFSGLDSMTWNTTASGQTAALAITCIYTPTGSGPWTISLSFLTGGGLGVFAATGVSLRVCSINL